VITLVIVFTAFVAGLAPTRLDAMDSFAASAESYLMTAFTARAAERASGAGAADVLLASSSDSDYKNVIATLSPRGVGVRWARDMASARKQAAGSGSVGMVIVDGAFPGSKQLVRDMKQRSPDIQVLVLDGPGRQTRIATALLDYASRQPAAATR
jgi:hypothetical protein